MEDIFPDSDFHLIIDGPEYRFASISLGGSILSSPFISDKMILFGCNDTYLYALDINGNKIWSYKTNDMIFSSPTMHADRIVVGSRDGFLYALTKNGELAWKFDSGDKTACTPLIVGNTVYFGSDNGVFYAVDLDNGKELWRFNHGSGIYMMSPSAANNCIISGHINGDIFCLSDEGRLLWNVNTGGPTAQAPLIIDSSGEHLGSFSKRSFDRFPKGKNPMAVIASYDSFLRCISIDSGKIAWKVFANSTGASSPTVSDGFIFFGSLDGNLYTVDIDGHIKRKFLTANRIVSSPVVSDGIVYFGSSDHNFYSVNVSSGRLVWRFLTDGEVISSPVIENGVIYFGSWDGNMYAISTKTKELLWKFKTAFSVPSYIKKPTTVVSDEPRKNPVFTAVSTLRGSEVKDRHYSTSTGELTNTFYTTSTPYKNKKPGYEAGSGKYR